jgi:hypothetical protein
MPTEAVDPSCAHVAGGSSGVEHELDGAIADPQSIVGDSCGGDGAGRRKTGSILDRANPDMLLTLNKIFSPGSAKSAVPLTRKSSYRSAMPDAATPGTNGNDGPLAPPPPPVNTETKTTRSKLLQKLLQPATESIKRNFFGSGGGSGSAPSFLDQLKARAGNGSSSHNTTSLDATADADAEKPVKPAMSFLDSIKSRRKE